MPLTQAQQQLQDLIIELHTNNPTQEIKVIQLPSTTKYARRMQLRGKRTCG